MVGAASARYPIISADGHAGAGMDAYREFPDPADSPAFTHS
ncbi:hypothetical protein [Embleya sp. AB8]